MSCSPELARPAGKAGCRLELQLLATWRRAGRALKSGDVESVHAFRAAQRRLETALRVFHGGSAPALPRGVRRFLKRLGQRAGVCRDLDVQLAWLAGALARLPPHQKPGARWMMARLEAKRDKALTRLQRELKQGRARSEHRLQTRIKALGSLKARKNRLPTAGALVARTIAAWSDQLDLQLAAIHSLRDWSEAHRARMTVKRIRFLLAPFAEGMRGAPAVIDRLIDLSDALGELHDLHQLAAELRLGYRDAVLTSADAEFDAVSPWPADQARSRPRHSLVICSGLKSLAARVSRQAEAQFLRFQVRWSRRQQAARLGDAVRRLVPALESPHLPPSTR